MRWDLTKAFPRQQLETSLIDGTDRQDVLAELLRKASTSPETSALLHSQFAVLAETIKAFTEAFPEISEQKGSSGSLSWASLSQTISRMKVQHEAKLEKGFAGKTEKQFHRVCEVLNDHAGFLKLLPKDEKYTAPICGSLELIVKASVNHQRVGEEFAAAMTEIDDIVAAVNRELSSNPPAFVLELSVQLCRHIVNFVAFPLRWYSQKRRKRVFSSFNENLTDKYQHQIAEIRRTSDNIQRGVRIDFELEMRGFVRKFPDVIRYFEEMRLSMARDNQRRNEENWAKLEAVSQKQMRRIEEEQESQFARMSQLLVMRSGSPIGEPIKELMDDRAHDFATRNVREEMDPDDSKSKFSVASVELRQLPSPMSEDPLLSRVEAEIASHDLNRAFDYSRIEPQDPEGNYFMEGDAAQRLQLWTAQSSPGILGILGPRAISPDDPARLLVSSYIRAARGAGIPCISYFCKLASGTPPAGRTCETMETVGLLYALIKQLLLYLPPQLPTRPTLSRQRFEELDGTLRTWDPALKLFSELVELATAPYLLIAVHGLEVLESGATTPLLKGLLAVLRESTGFDQIHKTKMKVLFATSGMSRTLGEGLEATEICDISRGSAARRPGGSGKGRQRLGIIDFAQE